MAIELRSVLFDFVPGPEPLDVVISPLTTLAATIGERRRAHPFKEKTYYAAMLRAYVMVDTHFGGPGDAIELTRGPIPTGTDQPLPGLEPATMHLLALHGLAILAHRIAEASSISGRTFHVMDLVAALLQDVSDDRGLLDGTSPGGPVVVGACPMPEGCADDDLDCRPICRLDANTLRARLASALAFDFLPSPLNQTTLSLADIRSFIEHLQTSVEPELFDDAEPAELDGPAPIVEVGSSNVLDERLDVITFGNDAVPVHTAGDGALIDLGQDATCPTVGKYLHRLAEPDTNPLRWQVVMRDRSGWPDNGDAPVALEYRVKLRDPESLPGSGSPDGCRGANPSDAEQAWLTDWLAAEPISSVDDGGVLYEVTLLRKRIPQLAETLQAELEIVFRGRDALEREAIACRCWNHVLLPVPLEVGEVTVATGPGSMAARSLHPGSNIAPLLNGAPLDEAPVLASFLIRNGTDEPAYVRFSVEQPLVQYTKCWRRSNAELSIIDVDPQCFDSGECLSSFPPDRQTVEAVDSGILEHLVTGLRIQEIPAQSSSAVELCDGCDVPEHTIAPRFASAGPRTYRVELLVSDLRALAPRTAVEPPDFYFETVLAPPYLTSMTGVVAADIFHVCTGYELGMCSRAGIYQYYRLIAAAELTFNSSLSVHTFMAPLSHTPLQATVAILGELESFTWSTHEHNLPNTLFPSSSSTSQCPIADGSVP